MKILYFFLIFSISVFAEKELQLLHKYATGRYGFHKINDSTFYTVDAANFEDSKEFYEPIYIHRTTDYGKTWDLYFEFDPSDIENEPSSKIFGLYSSFALDSNHFYFMGKENGELIITKNGGKTLKRIKTNAFKNAFGGIYMLDTLNGFISGFGFLKTTDGWKSWDTVRIENSYSYRNTYQRSDSNFVTHCSIDTTGNLDTEQYFINFNFFKEEIEIYHKFQFNPENTFTRIFSFISFLNDSVGFVGGTVNRTDDYYHDDLIFKTKDGGRTWKKVLDNYIHNSWSLQDMDMREDGYGVAKGQGPFVENKLYETYDYGESWEHVPFERKGAHHVSDIEFAGKRCLIGSYPDGMFLWDEITTTNYDPNLSDLHVFNHGDYLRIRTKEANLIIKIFDINGEEKISSKIQNNSPIYISEFQSGVYVFHILQGGAVVRSGKFIKQ